jgi:hypothetical protein
MKSMPPQHPYSHQDYECYRDLGGLAQATVGLQTRPPMVL